MKDLTPREIVDELDRFIIGQDDAKRAVAIAVRNRWRRQQLHPDLAREVMPKNIIMIGPTGVGKTEIARRLSRLVNAPFIKVEASKYTEVGYHGRDVESMVRDLLELGVNMVRDEHAEQVREAAEQRAEQRLVGLLLGETGQPPKRGWVPSGRAGRHDPDSPDNTEHETDDEQSHNRVRARLQEKLRDGQFEDTEIEITVTEKQATAVVGMMSPDQMDPSMASMLENLIPDKNKRRRVTVARARTILIEEETRDNSSTTRRSSSRRSSAPNSSASSSSTRSTRSPASAAPRPAPTSPARACSATCCRSSRARTSARATAS
jgi:ATP-dependent HslUV protease ATP-binding subunit HslU